MEVNKMIVDQGQGKPTQQMQEYSDAFTKLVAGKPVTTRDVYLACRQAGYQLQFAYDLEDVEVVALGQTSLVAYFTAIFMAAILDKPGAMLTDEQKVFMANWAREIVLITGESPKVKALHNFVQGEAKGNA